MINREWIEATVTSFVDDVDSYGVPRQTIASIRTIKVVPKIYSQTYVNNPLFNDVEIIALTKDKEVTDKNQITIDSVEYYVLHTIPSSRLTQLLLKKV